MASHVPCLQELVVSCPLGISACHLFCDASSSVQCLFCLRLIRTDRFYEVTWL